jgi:hypothetical protein
MRNNIRKLLHEHIIKIEEQNNKKNGSEDFIRKSKEIYGDKFDYSKVD